MIDLSNEFFAGPKGITISEIEKYCLKISGHARTIKRESGVSRDASNDERVNVSHGIECLVINKFLRDLINS